MSGCALFDTPDVELYFYDELDAPGRARVEAHLRGCAACRQRLDDLEAIRRALAARPLVDAPPGGDWSAFTRRLDGAMAAERAARDVSSWPRAVPAAGRAARRAWSTRPLLALAATLAIVTIGAVMAARFRSAPAPVAAPTTAERPPSTDAPSTANLNRSLREVSAEHLERSKLVVLGLATRDPDHTRAADWEYERHLAATLLTDTRLYRLQAADRGLSDIARVMRDLETVLIEASMSEPADRDALQRVQRLITKRDLMMKMHVVAANSAGN
jgi:hypothetical protein